MDNRNRRFLIQVMVLVIFALTILISVLAIFNNTQEIDKSIFIIIIITILIMIEVAFFFMMRSKYNSSTMGSQKLNKLIEYSKKRKELEEEINILTRELMQSDLAEYLDVNRLIFEGQDAIESEKGINYNMFLKQFGLLNGKIEKRKNSAVFLTPFTNEGEKLFRECQKILSNVDIFLQKTDNYVEKEDIIMNIVSLIVQSEIVIANINGRNANVYYELGIAHAIGKPTILLSEAKFDSDNIAFDIRQKRIIMYRSMQDLEQQLLHQVSRLKVNGE